MSRLIDNLCKVQAEVRRAADEFGNSRVKLLVVSKTMPLYLLQELYDHGIREFGENRIMELESKCAAMPDDVIWHFIGPVQSNKIRKILKCASVIHSIDSLEKLERCERIAGEEDVSPEIFLEVNISGEQSKGGMTPAVLPEVAAAAAKCRHIRFRGLMTMAPLAADHDELLQIFNALRELRDSVAEKCQCELPELSMGMSGDFPEAIACGASIVRVGSRIFEGVDR
jgi:pyridoxal phosphate enzyme (YggS family)